MDPSPSSHHTLPSPHSYALSGKIMLSAIAILFSLVLLILFLHFYVRWHVLRRAIRRARRRRRRFVFSADSQPQSTNKALDLSILNSLPVLLFSSSSASEDDSDSNECDCAVCLNEFEDGQKIRNLPLCGHSFHIECIDMWFSSHSNCPLCRAAVKAAPSASEEDVGSSSSDAGEGEVVIEVPEGEIEGLGGEAERLGLGLGLGLGLKWPISRIVLLRRFLGGEGAAPPDPAV